MTSPSGVLIREMTVADIPAGLSLSRASGWNQTERDWRFFLGTAPHGALVAVDSGGVVGTVATVPYGPFAWISMVLVDPAARRRGIGSLLLDKGLALISPGVTARLDATPAGEVVYRKLGFVGEYGLARLFVDGPRQRGARSSDVRPLTSSDWPTVHEMDRRAFGASRAALLERLAAEAPDYAFVVGRDGRLQGYVLGRHGERREHVGPLVAENIDVARRLLDACLDVPTNRGVFLDAPDDQVSWRHELVDLGFAIERPFLRMSRGTLATPGQPSLVYAITGPEFG